MHRVALALGLALLFAVTGCGLLGDGSAGRSTSPDGTAAAPPSPPTDPGPSTPAGTPIPGFEDWQVINPQAVQITVEDGALVMHITGALAWSNADRGVLLYREVTGDFRAIATVRTSKAADPLAPPGQDGTNQLAGLMARVGLPADAPNDAQAENYVMISTGSIAMSTGLQTKTTTTSQSVTIQRQLPTGGDAELRLCRAGPTFLLSWRHVDSTEAWTRISTFERGDMPQALQVGASIYADAMPDIIARFEDVAITRLAPGEAC